MDSLDIRLNLDTQQMDCRWNRFDKHNRHGHLLDDILLQRHNLYSRMYFVRLDHKLRTDCQQYLDYIHIRLLLVRNGNAHFDRILVDKLEL